LSASQSLVSGSTRLLLTPDVINLAVGSSTTITLVISDMPIGTNAEQAVLNYNTSRFTISDMTCLGPVHSFVLNHTEAAGSMLACGDPLPTKQVYTGPVMQFTLKRNTVGTDMMQFGALGNKVSQLAVPLKELALVTEDITLVPVGVTNVLLIQDTICANTDTNHDGRVDILDLSVLSANFGKTGTNLPGDVNCDGKVDIYDLSELGKVMK
jgi:hypothetical protein